MQISYSEALRLAAISLVLLLLPGCGKGDRPPLGMVHGVVTLDGQPLEGAIVYFSPEQGGRVSQDMTDDKGEFDLVYIGKTPGAKTGKHQVRITTAYEYFDEAKNQSIVKKERVPKRYNSKDTELTATVEGGRNLVNFDLESK